MEKYRKHFWVDISITEVWMLWCLFNQEIAEFHELRTEVGHKILPIIGASLSLYPLGLVQWLVCGTHTNLHGTPALCKGLSLQNYKGELYLALRSSWSGGIQTCANQQWPFSKSSVNNNILGLQLRQWLNLSGCDHAKIYTDNVQTWPWTMTILYG